MQWSLTLFLLVSTSVVTSSIQCPHGYETPDNRLCYKAYAVVMNRADASAQCAVDGGYLASIPSEHNNKYLANVTNRFIPGGIWLGITCSGSLKSCKNDDGTPFGPYSNFSPDSIFSSRCVYTNSSDWFADIECSYQLSFICELPLGNLCHHGYSFWRGNCYALYPSDTEDNAERNCKGFGGHLASIHTDKENEYVLSLVGDSVFRSTTMARIGLQLRNDSHYNWLDGTEVDYKRIDFLDPDIGECFGLSLHNHFSSFGKWSSVNCLNSLPFVCKSEVLRRNGFEVHSPLQCNANNFLGGFGKIYSPGYPLPYVRSDCVYLITTEIGQNIEIYFPYVNIDITTTISFYDDISDSQPSFELDSTTKSLTLISSYNQITIVFKSQSDVAQIETGWILNYKSVIFTPSIEKN